MSETEAMLAPPGGSAALESEATLWRRLRRDNDPAAREELVRRYIPFARRLAARYRSGVEPFDDLVQVAHLGLINAIDRFDPERGAPFPGYATPTILGELKRHFRDRSWTVRIPRGAHDLLARVEPVIAKLTVELQRAPSVPEIAAALEADPSEVLDALHAAQNRKTLSLDRPVDDEDDGGSSAEWIGGEDHGYELVDDWLSVEAAIHALDERERRVVQMRFAEDRVQSQIADALGCSQMQVSRILRKALQKLREAGEGVVPAEQG